MKLYYISGEGQRWRAWPDNIPQPKLMDLYFFRYKRLEYVNWYGVAFVALMVSNGEKPSHPYVLRWGIRDGITEGLLR